MNLWKWLPGMMLSAFLTGCAPQIAPGPGPAEGAVEEPTPDTDGEAAAPANREAVSRRELRGVPSPPPAPLRQDGEAEAEPTARAFPLQSDDPMFPIELRRKP